MRTSPLPTHRFITTLRQSARQALVAFLCGALVTPATAETSSLADLTIEQLLNESITSVSKRAQRLADAAAAISLITHDDLRRSGVTNIPDALRMVPGIEVAAVNGGQWAITSRGFNDGFANKLLVLIDGRAVYTPLFSGVHWDLQHTMLEDVAQIEVIRGPGATLWGANAVNGVINIVSRSAQDTQGGLLYGGAGNIHEALAGFRYGGQIGDQSYFRVFGTYQQQAANVRADGASADDGWQTVHGGFRLDRRFATDSRLMWEAATTRTNLDGGASNAVNTHTIGRWTRTFSRGNSFEIQGYLDRLHEDEFGRSRQTIDTIDLTTQHNFELGERHNLVWGLGYRGMETKVEQNNPVLIVRRGRLRHALASAYVQDELRLIPERLTLTGGVKLEHNDFTGVEIQPSIRGVFKPTPNQTTWAAMSRAVRTPSELEYEDVFSIAVGAPFRGPGGGLYLPRLVGNNTLRSEVLWAYQLGWRAQLNPRTSLDVTGFYNKYDRIAEISGTGRFAQGFPLGTAETMFQNSEEGDTYGGEATLSLAVTRAWRIDASYSALAIRVGRPANPNAPVFETGSPKHQVKLRSAFDFSKRAGFDVQLRFVDKLMTAPAYFEADVRFAFQLNDATELSLVGQNLLDRHHPEHGPGPITSFSETRRGFYAKLTHRF